MTARETIDEQIAYYRARASEYDEWFFRRARYDHGDEANRLWSREAAALRQQVSALPPCGSVLELACGTGIWTGLLCHIGRCVTAVDSSPEVIAINRAKLPSAAVEYIQADLFAWEPPASYDLVFIAFWLSHVPPEELDPFLAKVSRAVRPAGLVFAMDSLPDDLSGAAGAQPKDPSRTVELRRINDGREFRVVKVYYRPEQLQSAFARHGFTASVGSTGRFFWFARANR
jgi:demethylmenaquinone methyltransferase/2-methoxy-6-polyprenyl-1,4-benzoquinol methylase